VTARLGAKCDETATAVLGATIARNCRCELIAHPKGIGGTYGFQARAIVLAARQGISFKIEADRHGQIHTLARQFTRGGGNGCARRNSAIASSSSEGRAGAPPKVVKSLRLHINYDIDYDTGPC
jgi:hypothetical protein